MTLPTAEAVDGYTFKGWVTAAIAAETTTTPTILTGTYTPSASVTLYAVYTRTETTTGSGSSVYTLVTDPAQLQIGSSIIFTANGTGTAAMSATQGTNNRAEVTGGTKSTDSSTFTPAAGTGEFVLGYGTTDGTYSFYDNGNSGYLYAASSTKNYLKTQSTLDANGSWKIAISSNEATITAQGSNTRNILRYNSTSKLFSCYSSGQQTVNIYQKGSGTTTTTYYTTSPVVCAHSSTTTTTVDATCTTAGSVTVTCDACGIVLSTDTIPATGHSYGDWASNNNGTHSRTCSVCGDVETADCTYTSSVSGATTTYTCSVCGYSYSEVKDTYTVTYSAPSGTTTADVLDGETVTLPTADAVEGYTFSGWVTAAIDPETTAAPTILTGTYTPTASVTLYAVYTRTVSTGSGAASLTKMAAGDTLSAGDNIVVVANGTTVAMYQETISSSYVNLFTFDGNVESIAANSKNYWTVVAGSATDTYVLGDAENGYLYTSGSNNLAASSSASSDWTLVDNGDGTFKLQANGRNLSYRSDLTSNIYWRMGGQNYGTSGKIVLDIYKYVPGSASTTYYTTNPTVTAECAHTNVTAVAAVNATCTTAGNLAYWHCTDCDKYFSDAAYTTETTPEAVTVSALGHTWVEATEGDNYVAPTCTETGLAYMVCSVCGEVGAGRELPALGHDMVPGTVHPATCTEDGYTEYACSRCDANDIGDIVAATGHTEVTDAAVAATCTATGLTAGSHCSVCNEVIVAQTEVAALGHSYTYVDNGDGTHTATCSVCNATITEDHAFVEGTCICGATEVEEDPYLDSALVFYNKSLSLESSIKAQFIIKPSNLTGYTDFYVSFNHIDPDGKETATTDTGYVYYKIYNVYEMPVAAKEMSDTIQVTLYGYKNGQWYHGETVEWIVRDALVNGLRNSTKDSYKVLAASILNYGAAAQNFFSYNTDNLANATLTEEELALAITTPDTLQNNGSTGGTAAGVSFVGKTLALESAIEMQFIFSSTKYANTQLEAHISYTLNGETKTEVIDGTKLEVVSGKYYTLRYSGIAAKDLRTVVTVTIYDKTTGNAVSQSISYSAETYCYEKLNSTSATAALKSMCTAVMCYIDAAAAYFG